MPVISANVPRATARSNRPRNWRSDPSNRAWRPLTPADPIAGSGSGLPLDDQAHDRATGHAPQLGDRAVHTVAPRSSITWFHAHASPWGPTSSAGAWTSLRREPMAGRAGEDPRHVGVDDRARRARTRTREPRAPCTARCPAARAVRRARRGICPSKRSTTRPRSRADHAPASGSRVPPSRRSTSAERRLRADRRRRIGRR